MLFYFIFVFNPPALFSGNYLTPLTFLVSLQQLMASLYASQFLLFLKRKANRLCLYLTLLLLGIKCCLLIKMSPWQRIHRKEWVFFLLLCLVSETGWLSLIPERYLIILLVRPQWGQWSVRGGTVTQLWQPSGTSDGWHARMGHAAFPGACVDRLRLRISHSASVRLIAGHAGHRCDTWISLL